MTDEGLRIQIVDLQNRSLFESGSAQLTNAAAKLLRQVANTIAAAPNTIAAAPNDIKVSGHTDATPYAAATAHSNWELSSDRANASRRALIAVGVPEARIKEVIGRADTEPFDPADPLAPVNRRITIVLKNLPPARPTSPSAGRQDSGPSISTISPTAPASSRSSTRPRTTTRASRSPRRETSTATGSTTSSSGRTETARAVPPPARPMSSSARVRGLRLSTSTMSPPAPAASRSSARTPVTRPARRSPRRAM